MEQLSLKFKRNFRQEAEEFYALRKATGVPLSNWITIEHFERRLKENPSYEFYINQDGLYSHRLRRR